MTGDSSGIFLSTVCASALLSGSTAWSGFGSMNFSFDHVQRPVALGTPEYNTALCFRSP